MLGTVGVAPANREVRSSLTPDAFGGNMDTPEMRAGVTCYLPVNEPGALFSVGDGHYRQGEGESCGTAVEGAMDVDADRRAGEGLVRARRRCGRAWSPTTSSSPSARPARSRTPGGSGRRR